jgi:hypothetical protein
MLSGVVTGPFPAVVLVLPDPVMDRRRADAALDGGRRDGFTGADERDNPSTELRWKRSRHGRSLSEQARSSEDCG